MAAGGHALWQGHGKLTNRFLKKNPPALRGGTYLRSYDRWLAPTG